MTFDVDQFPQTLKQPYSHAFEERQLFCGCLVAEVEFSNELATSWSQFLTLPLIKFETCAD